MTDIEQLIGTFRRMGIEHSVIKGDPKENAFQVGHTVVEIEAGAGYDGFYAHFFFDSTGKFLYHCVAE